MKIDGKAIALEIQEDLAQKVIELKKKHIYPRLVVILVGDDPASNAYVLQKEKKATEIGIQTTICRVPKEITEKRLLALILEANENILVHGIIVQRPLPETIDAKKINQAVIPEKDIDGFHSKTLFTMPLASAVMNIFEYIYYADKVKGKKNYQLFMNWLKNKHIVIFGKGETGGGPMITKFKNLGITPRVIDSKTKHPDMLTKQADIVISAVGKPNTIQPAMLRQGVILLGIGMHRNNQGKLQGDYNEEDIKNIASYYTPIPGGIGPVNVVMLLRNLVDAVEN